MSYSKICAQVLFLVVLKNKSDTRDWTWIGHMQGKHPGHCTIALALVSSQFFVVSILISEEANQLVIATNSEWVVLSSHPWQHCWVSFFVMCPSLVGVQCGLICLAFLWWSVMEKYLFVCLLAALGLFVGGGRHTDDAQGFFLTSWAPYGRMQGRCLTR